MDDDEQLIRSLEQVLTSSGWKVLCYTSADAFLEEFDPTRPGCLVLDLCLVGTSGLGIQSRLKQLGSRTPIVFITGGGDLSTAVEALKEGALDCLEKPLHSSEILSAVERAVARDAEQRARSAECAAVRARIDRLTAREREVLDLVAAGRLNKQIAADLGISERTVEVHRHRGMKKVGVDSAVDLLRLILVRNGNA